MRLHKTTGFQCPMNDDGICFCNRKPCTASEECKKILDTEYPTRNLPLFIPDWKRDDSEIKEEFEKIIPLIGRQ